MKKSPTFVEQWFKSRDEQATRAWSGIALDGNSQHGTVWTPIDAPFLDDLQVMRNSVQLSIFVQPRIQQFPKQPRKQAGSIAGAFTNLASTVCYRAVMTVGFDVPFHDQIRAEFESHELEITHTIANQVSRAFGREISASDSESLDKMSAHVMVACVGLLELPSYVDVGTSIALEIWVQVPPDDMQSLAAVCADNLKCHVQRKAEYRDLSANIKHNLLDILAKFTLSKGNSNEPH